MSPFINSAFNDTSTKVEAEIKTFQKQKFNTSVKEDVTRQFQFSKEAQAIQDKIDALKARLLASQRARRGLSGSALKKIRDEIARLELELENLLIKERTEATIKAKEEQLDFFTSLGKSIGTALEVLNNPIAATQNLFTQVFFELTDVTALNMLQAKKIQLEGLALIASDSELKAIQAGEIS